MSDHNHHHHDHNHSHGYHTHEDGSRHYDAVDLQARKIVEFITAIAVELPLDAFIKDKKESFIEQMNIFTEAMLEANNHVRNYRVASKKIEKDFKKAAFANPDRKGKDISQATPELTEEYIAYLNAIKPALDSLVKMINITIGSDFTEWDVNTKDGIVESGVKVLEYLEGLPKEQQDKLIGMADVVREALPSFSYLAELKNMAESADGSPLTPLTFQHQKKVVMPVLIQHEPGKYQELIGFLDNSLSYFINFAVGILLRGLSYNQPGIVIIRAADRHGIVAYRAVPIDMITKKSAGK